MQISSIKITIGELEGRLRNKDAIIEEYNYKETQLQQEVTRWKSQVGLLNQEIERINDFSQKKYHIYYAEYLKKTQKSRD